MDIYGQTRTHFVAAEDEKEAWIKAADEEALNTVEWNDEFALDGSMEVPMIYSLASVAEITQEDVRALHRMGIIDWTVTA